MKNTLKHSIQIVAGLLFIASGLFKMIDSQGFSTLITRYGFSWAGNYSPVILSAEIILGFCLILNIKPKTTAMIVAIITTLFTISFAYAFFFRGVDDCGCMGSFIRIPPYVSFSRNILIIAGCIWIWKNFENHSIHTKDWKKWIVYIAGGTSLCISGYSLAKPLTEQGKIQVGDQLNTTVFRYMYDKVSTDTAIVFIFRPSCDHCWNVTENIKSIKRTPGFENVIGLTYANVDTSQYMREMKPNFEVIMYPTDELYNYVIGVPVLLVLENGKVIKKFRAGDVPCGPMLKKMLKEK